MHENHVDLKWSDGDMIHPYVGEAATQNEVIDHTIGGKITATYERQQAIQLYKLQE